MTNEEAAENYRWQSRTQPVEPDELLQEEWFELVAATRDSDLRAHQIALTYSKAAEALDRYVHKLDGESEETEATRQKTRIWNANWFHFSTWGTLTVTRNIANDSPPQRLDGLPLVSLRQQLAPLVVHARASDGQRVGRLLAWAQLQIFISVCPAVADLVQQEKPDEGAAGVPPRDLPDGWAGGIQEQPRPEWAPKIESRHKEAVARAMLYYDLARRTDDDCVRARLVFGGNVLMSAMEQDLIDGAVDAVVDQVPHRIAHVMDGQIARSVERLTGYRSQLTSLGLPFRFGRARATLDTAWSRVMADQVLVVALPTETLRIGRDIPPWRPGRPYYPKPLRRLRDHPPGLAPDVQAVLEEIADLVDSVDRTRGDGRGSAARDWRRWDERLNFATTLMRSRQPDPTLYWAPYMVEDQDRIVRGKLPHRTGDPSALEVQAPANPILEPDDVAAGR
jgi:hypothetical protein